MSNSTPNPFTSLKQNFKGDIDYAEKTLDTYSHDASLFEVRPQVVMFPKDSEDIQSLVRR
jgi:FAD/FMN-containing dehydrogenase